MTDLHHHVLSAPLPVRFVVTGAAVAIGTVSLMLVLAFWAMRRRR